MYRTPTLTMVFSSMSIICLLLRFSRSILFEMCFSEYAFTRIFICVFQFLFFFALLKSAFLVRILGDVHFGSGLVRFNPRLVFAAEMNSYIINVHGTKQRPRLRYCLFLIFCNVNISLEALRKPGVTERSIHARHVTTEQAP